MRLFLNDYTTIEALDTLREYWETSEDRLEYGESFDYFLSSCMAKNNGTLLEILTEETPEEETMSTVSLYKVEHDDWDGEYEVGWHTPAQAFRMQWKWGYRMTKLDTPTEAGDAYGFCHEQYEKAAEI